MGNLKSVQQEKPGQSEVQMGEHKSNQLSEIDFKRYTRPVTRGEGMTRWITGKFRDCPLCKKPSTNWEVGIQKRRVYFRCPDCMGIISVNRLVVRGRGVFSLWRTLRYSYARKEARVESVGNNSNLQYLEGQEYPIEEMQEWTHK